MDILKKIWLLMLIPILASCFFSQGIAQINTFAGIQTKKSIFKQIHTLCRDFCNKLTKKQILALAISIVSGGAGVGFLVYYAKKCSKKVMPDANTPSENNILQNQSIPQSSKVNQQTYEQLISDEILQKMRSVSITQAIQFYKKYEEFVKSIDNIKKYNKSDLFFPNTKDNVEYIQNALLPGRCCSNEATQADIMQVGHIHRQIPKLYPCLQPEDQEKFLNFMFDWLNTLA